MANEPLAQATEPEAPSEDDYQAFCAALSETARGRAFLAEYARRQRAAETAMLLTAVERLEELVRSQVPAVPAPQPSFDTTRQELLVLLDGIRDMQAEIDAAALTAQVAKLASLIGVVGQRLEAIVAAGTSEPAAPAYPGPDNDKDAAKDTVKDTAEPVAMSGECAATEPPDETALADATAATEQPDRAPLRPASAEPSAAEQVPESTAIPDVGWFDEEPVRTATAENAATPTDYSAATLAIGVALKAAMAAAEAEAPKVTVYKAGTIPPPAPFAGEDFANAEPAGHVAEPEDPLAPIMALSEEERIALFT